MHWLPCLRNIPDNIIANNYQNLQKTYNNIIVLLAGYSFSFRKLMVPTDISWSTRFLVGGIPGILLCTVPPHNTVVAILLLFGEEQSCMLCWPIVLSPSSSHMVSVEAFRKDIVVGLRLLHLSCDVEMEAFPDWVWLYEILCWTMWQRFYAREKMRSLVYIRSIG